MSGYLNEIEAAVECKTVRGRPGGGSVTAALKGDSSLLRVKREDGERRASVRDFHSFRVTWVTLALTAGVPLELVQKVTGHKTTDIVLKHYFQPGREDFRQTLQSAMPKLLTNGHKTPKEEMRELLETVKPKALGPAGDIRQGANIRRLARGACPARGASGGGVCSGEAGRGHDRPGRRPGTCTFHSKSNCEPQRRSCSAGSLTFHSPSDCFESTGCISNSLWRRWNDISKHYGEAEADAADQEENGDQDSMNVESSRPMTVPKSILQVMTFMSSILFDAVRMP